MKKAYVIGPYRAECPNGIHANIERARGIAVALWDRGYAAFCPHMNSAFMDGSCPDEDFMNGDLAWLSHADVAVCTGNWFESAGSRAEVKFCEGLGIPVYEGIGALDRARQGVTI